MESQLVDLIEYEGLLNQLQIHLDLLLSNNSMEHLNKHLDSVESAKLSCAMAFSLNSLYLSNNYKGEKLNNFIGGSLLGLRALEYFTFIRFKGVGNILLLLGFIR